MEFDVSKQWSENNCAFAFTPFVRLDSTDNERTHADIRELTWRYSAENWRITAGIDKVFWGVTEVYHLIDIINQTDLIEHPEGKQKLGQPMINFVAEPELGSLELFYLPYFRERTFPGETGRFRTQHPVNNDSAQYESKNEKWNQDWAIRFFKNFGSIDLGLSHFSGTNREPRLLPYLDNEGKIKLMTYYETVRRSSIDTQATYHDILFKFEALYLSGGNQDYRASTGGIEYSLTGIIDDNDLSFLCEYFYDSRRKEATTQYDNDLFVGLRLTFNDGNGSDFLAGMVKDLDNNEKIYILEANTRLNEILSLKYESRHFRNTSADSILGNLRQDSYFSLSLTTYF